MSAKWLVAAAAGHEDQVTRAPPPYLFHGVQRNPKIITEFRRGVSAYLPQAYLGGELILAVRDVPLM